MIRIDTKPAWMTGLRVSSPAILLVIGFTWFFFIPNQRLISSRLAEYDKKSEQGTKKRQPIDELKSKLLSAQSESTRLAGEIAENDRRLQEISADKASLQLSIRRAKSPANAIATTLELLRQNELVCVDSEVLSGETSSLARSSSKPKYVSTQIGTSGSALPKTKYRIHIRGRFPDVRKAMNALHQEQPLVIPVSIEMDGSNPDEEIRNWTLIVLV